LLPERLLEPLAARLERVRRMHASDIRNGTGFVELPYALGIKYPNAAREWGWHGYRPPASPRVGCRAGSWRVQGLFRGTPMPRFVTL
jgi:hypothetical protein